MKRLILLIFAIGAFIGSLWIGWTFRSGNASRVDLDLIWVRVPDLELWVLLLLAMGLGASVATVIVGFAWLRGRIVNRRYRKAIKKLEAELHQMRSLPLAGSQAAALDADPELALAKQE